MKTSSEIEFVNLPWMVWQLANDEKSYGRLAGQFIITTMDGEHEVTGPVASQATAQHIVDLHNIVVQGKCDHVDFDEDQNGHMKCVACGLEADTCPDCGEVGKCDPFCLAKAEGIRRIMDGEE